MTKVKKLTPLQQRITRELLTVYHSKCRSALTISDLAGRLQVSVGQIRLAIGPLGTKLRANGFAFRLHRSQEESPFFQTRDLYELKPNPSRPASHATVIAPLADLPCRDELAQYLA